MNNEQRKELEAWLTAVADATRYLTSRYGEMDDECKTGFSELIDGIISNLHGTLMDFADYIG